MDIDTAISKVMDGTAGCDEARFLLQKLREAHFLLQKLHKERKLHNEARALHHSMVLGGERPSEQSEQIYREGMGK